MRVSEILIKAKAQIEQGWCKNALNDGQGGVCALGALFVAENSEVLGAVGLRAFGLLSDVAPFVEGDSSSLVNFNNHPQTTKDDILAWFSAAIAIAEQQEARQPEPLAEVCACL